MRMKCQEDLANDVYIVLLAYIAVFLPWTAVSTMDFITGDWKSVRNTRFDGRIQLLLGLLPIPYIAYYIVLQALACDYKELLTAVVGVISSIVHVTRTSWGLWQLREFQYWAANSIVTLNDIGIKYVRSGDSSKGSKKEGWRLQKASKSWMECTPNERLQKAMDDALNLEVNETLVDNAIFSGFARCFLTYYDHTLRVEPFGKESGGKRSRMMLRAVYRLVLVPKYVAVFFSVCLETLAILFCRKFLKKSNYHSRTGLRLVPHDPVDLSTRWLVAFAAQGLGHWINDFKIIQDPPNIGDPPFDAADYSARRDLFAGQVLAGATLHLFGGTGANINSQKPEFSYQRGKFPGMMVWTDRDISSSVSNGIVARNELLHIALRSGLGLPFSAAQTQKGKESLKEGYSPYRYKFESMKASMPAEFGREISQLTIPQLEWLTIFLFLGAKDPERLGREAASAAIVSSLHLGTKLKEPPKDTLEEQSAEALDSPEANDLALQTLKYQLGFYPKSLRYGKNPEPSSSKPRTPEQLCAYPLMPGAIGGMLEHNRNVLKVSSLVDLWCSLEAGKQFEYLLKFDQNWSRTCDGNCSSDRTARSSPLSAECQSKLQCERCGSIIEDTNNTLEVNKAFERARLEYQFSVPKQPYHHLEQTITFLGVSMEHVRSELAHWAVRQQDEREELSEAHWERPLPQANRSTSLPDLAVLTTKTLSKSLCKAKSIEYLYGRSVQIALIFELQATLHERMVSGSASPSSVETMISCLLSFPALIVLPRIAGAKTRTIEDDRFSDLDQPTPEDSRNISEWELLVSPACAPQNLAVKIQFEKHEGQVLMIPELSVTNGEDSRDICFKWQWWRDAFLGRLHAFAEWQESHEMYPMLVHPTEGPIQGKVLVHPTEGPIQGKVDQETAGRTFQTWEGWLPFRSEISRFELETEGVLKQYEIEEDFLGYYRSPLGKLHPALRKEKLVPVVYRSRNNGGHEASRATLRQASKNLSETLRPGIPGVNEHSNRSQKQARHEILGHGLCLQNSETRESCGNLNQREKEDSLEEQNFAENEALNENMENNTDLLAQNQAEGEVANNTAVASAENSETRDRDSDGISEGKDLVSQANAILKGKHGICLRKNLRPEEVERALLLYERAGTEYGETEAIDESIKILVDEERGDLRRATNLLERCSASMIEKYIRNRDHDMPGDTGKRAARAVFSRLSESFQILVTRTGRNPLAVSAFGTFIKVMDQSGLWLEKSVVEEIRKHARISFLRCGDSKLIGILGTLETIHRPEGTGPRLLRSHSRTRSTLEQAFFKKAVAEGSRVEAMYNLERMLSNHGEEIEVKDDNDVILRYEEAMDNSEKGVVPAMYMLEKTLRNEPPDVSSQEHRAAGLYLSGLAEKNFLTMLNNLAYLYRKDVKIRPGAAEKVVSVYQKAISRNDTQAMNELGNIYSAGIPNFIRKNLKKAIDCYDLAIESADDPEAKYNKANLLVKDSVSAAIDLYKDAADNGNHVKAMYRLAELYRSGEYLDQNLVRAKEFYEKAIASGHVPSMLKLAQLLSDGAGQIDRQPKRAFDLYLQVNRSSQAGPTESHQAMYHLALLLRNGKNGVPQDKDLAEKLLLKLTSGIMTDNLIFANGMYALGDMYDMGNAGVSHRAGWNGKVLRYYSGAIVAAWKSEKRHVTGRKLARSAGITYQGTEVILQEKKVTLAGAALTSTANTETPTSVNVEIVVSVTLRALNLKTTLGQNPRLQEDWQQYVSELTDGWVMKALIRLGDVLQITDAESAQQLWKLGVEHGNAESMFKLGKLLARQRKLGKARELLESAADLGYEKANWALGRLLANGYPPNLKEALQKYELAAAAKVPEAMVSLSEELMKEGRKGVPYDPARAHALLDEVLRINPNNLDARQLLTKAQRLAPNPAWSFPWNPFWRLDS